MSFNRVLLLFPEYKGTQFGATHPPAGLGYISEALCQNHIEHRVVDMRLDPGIGNLQSAIRRFGPDLVGASMMTLLHRDSYRLLEQIKQASPGVSIAAGGPHVSTFREKALEQCPAIDFGIAREGEGAIVELCRGRPPAEIAGLYYRSNDGVAYTGDRPFKIELDAVAYPRYEKFDLQRYITDEIPILTSRGCPYKCIYCPVKTAIGRKFRTRSPANIADEIEYWYARGRRHFGIVDDNFLMSKKRVVELCRQLRQRDLQDLELRCPNGVRADHCDRLVLEQMKKAGFKCLAFGVEAGNDRILGRLKKGESIEVVRRAVADACELGYEVILFFLVGSPGETRRDIEDSVEFALSHPIFDAKFYNIVPFPDTELFDWLSENRLFIRRPDDYLNDASHWDSEPVFETPELPRAERIKALEYTGQVRRNIRKKAMERKLRRLGVFSKLAAAAFVSNAVQYQLLHNYTLRRLGTKIFRAVTG